MAQVAPPKWLSAWSLLTCPPPRSINRARPLLPRQFWLTLTVESRERILGALSRVVAQQLAAPPAIQEATNERT